MRLIKQNHLLNINNIDVVRENISKHGPLLPSNIRCIIAGPSNCGKTNVMISLLENPNGISYENVYIYSKYLPKYEYLRNLLKPIKNLGYYEYTDSENITHPSNAKKHSIFIFDDVACDKQSVIRDFFAMGRHNNVVSFYLCQSYTRIPKHLIRDNANILILFPQDVLNLKHVYEDHVNADMKFDKFKDLCNLCWQDKYGFVVIDKTKDCQLGRYRKGFHYFIKL